VPDGFSNIEFVRHFSVYRGGLLVNKQGVIYMKRFILAASLAAVSAVGVFAQAAVDDYKKGEFYVGYSNGQVDTGFDSGNTVGSFFRDRANFNGVNVSGVYNFNRYLGAKGDFSATFNKTQFNEPFLPAGTTTPSNVTFNTKNSLYNLVGGVQVKDNANSGVFKPFAHAMVGLAHVRTKVSDVTCTPSTPCPFVNQTFSDNGLSGVLGGGLDLRLNNRIQIRAIQLDYNPVRANGQTDNNLRIGAGIVF
jgi:opacity protein-like surface antigen